MERIAKRMGRLIQGLNECSRIANRMEKLFKGKMNILGIFSKSLIHVEH